MKPKATLKLDKLIYPKPSIQAAQLLQLLAKSDIDLSEIDRIILQDPVLAGVMIRYANSPLFRRGGEITNVPTATRLIGFKNIRSAVVMATLNSVLPANSSAAKRVQRHSLGIACVARLIARQVCPDLADDLELLGLLHDIGMVVLVCNAPYQYDALLLEALTHARAVDEVERRQLGFSHERINEMALHDFRLSPEYVNMVNHLHQPYAVAEPLPDLERMREVLLLAHSLLAEYDADAFIPENLSVDDTTDDKQSVLISHLDVDKAQVYQDYLQYRYDIVDAA